MKVARALVLSLLLVASSAVAQDHPAINAQPNTVYVGADGRFEAAPDTALLQMNISVQEQTAQVAYEEAATNVEQVRKVLRANGLEPKTASVGFFAVQPVYDWKPKQHLVGYRVTTDVTLKLKDFSKIGPIRARPSATSSKIWMKPRTGLSKTPTGGPATPPKPWPTQAAVRSETFPTPRSIHLKIPASCLT
jgi:uncharacterized protein YggE